MDERVHVKLHGVHNHMAEVGEIETPRGKARRDEKPPLQPAGTEWSDGPARFKESMPQYRSGPPAQAETHRPRLRVRPGPSARAAAGDSPLQVLSIG